MVSQPDIAKLILRVGFAGLFLLHGIHKMHSGVTFIEGKLLEFGVPAFFAYAVFLGEVVAPILIIISLFTRLSAFVCVMTSVVVIILMHSHNFFSLTKVGAWSIEGIATFLCGFLARMLLGSGKYAIKAD